MAECNWDPKKHGGRPCPVHGGGGLWDENVFTRQEKLKKAGYTDEDLKDADEDFDGDYDDEFKPTADDFMEELSDNDYIYGGLGEQDIYNKMAERLSKKYNTEITPEEVANGLKEGGFIIDEFNKSLDGGEELKSVDETLAEDDKKKDTFKLPEKIKNEFLDFYNKYHNYEFKKVPIEKLIEDNDLLNDEDLESYHTKNWNGAKAKDFHIDNDKINKITISEIPYATERENGKIILGDGRHRIRALYNDGFKYIELPIDKQNEE